MCKRREWVRGAQRRTCAFVLLPAALSGSDYREVMAIESRDLKFELSDLIASQWPPRRAEFSHVANGVMALLPYLARGIPEGQRLAVN
jgi:hypothetical protein